MLKTQPNSIEAINNKAWILHTYLGQTGKALELVLALRKRVSSAALARRVLRHSGLDPGVHRPDRDAEQSYLEGLKKSPEHPVLNFHFGKMIASDRGRAVKAKPYLKTALAAGERLSPPMKGGRPPGSAHRPRATAAGDRFGGADAGERSRHDQSRSRVWS